MFEIYKITSDTTVDFASEELKKYLRMMQPRSGDVSIKYEPNATKGFRIGLMADFGLDTSDAENIELDDIVYVDCNETGGIIAGSNPRSVLFAVYRFLTENGCRWLYPGVDGEYIPIKNLTPVKYRKMADCRYRGQCNEGAEFQQSMLDMIDFTPKVFMNVFMMEFDIPGYYTYYYEHIHNKKYRPSEPVSQDTILQWKRQCEVEISKRGLQFHDMGHGWTTEALSIKSASDWAKKDESIVPESKREFLPMINGKRQLFEGVPINTNICMSNPKARKVFVDGVIKYAKTAENVDYLHVWLADAYNNHCECDECRKKTPSDWYVMMMNELDKALSENGLKTRIVFICYLDTTMPPLYETIENPDRFSLLIAPITRNYVTSVPQTFVETETEKYVLNNFTFPRYVESYLTYGRQWASMMKTRAFSYEYHFWKHQYYDFGVFDFAKLIHSDIKGYKINGIDGIVEDGSQRSFFPNGFNFYVYANTLFDNSTDFDYLVEDYFSRAYGEDYKKVIDFFKGIGETFTHKYITDCNLGKSYNPDMTALFNKGIKLIEDFKPFVEAHLANPYRVQTVSYKILNHYLNYLRELGDIFIIKCNGDDALAKR